MRERTKAMGTVPYWRQVVLKAAAITVISAALILLIFSVFGSPAASALPIYRFVQGDLPEVTVLPAGLERISWGAVLAGAILALAIQISINLLAVSRGAGTFNPQYESDGDIKESVMTSAVWIGVGTLAAMFVGGWVAARFAGMPEGVDGMLHGLMVWAVVTLVSLIFLGSAVGRLLGGVASLVGRGLSLAGRATETAVRGAASVAQGAAHVAKDAVSGVANVAQDVASGTTHAAADAAGGLRDVVEKAVDASPELRDAAEQIELARDSIEAEARRMLRKAGVAPDQVRQRVTEKVDEVRERVGEKVDEVRDKAANGEVAPKQLKAKAREAVADVEETAKQVAEQFQNDPEEAIQTVNLALRRVFRKGQLAVNEVDRDALVEMLVERGNMSETEARETLARWEDRFNQAKADAENVRMQVQERVEKLQEDARKKAEELQGQLREKAEDARIEAERVAREAAQATSDAVAQIAGVVFAVIVISGVAAAIGGWIGTPERLPTAEVTSASLTSDHQISVASASFFLDLD